MDLDLIRKDFAAFADPATPVEVHGNVIKWVQGHEARSATLVPSAQIPDIVFGERTFSYGEFFASPFMADLRGLAEMMRLTLPRMPGYVGAKFVEPKVTFDDTKEEGRASELLQSQLKERTPDRTQLLFLHGRAGDGKSALLVHLSLVQAESFSKGNANSVYFYINAQGSALARIDEVVAKTLQDFRARFTYHAVATLTRLHLLVPIIDGFDELLGVGGYKDAFSSLGLFVSRLDGKGTVIASARSTFYQYTNFGAQAARFATDENPLLFSLIPVSLHPWGKNECLEFLEKAHFQVSVPELQTKLGPRSEEILSSPFLFSQLVSLGPDVITKVTDRHVVRIIVEELVRREMQEKLLDPQGKPLLTIQQHIELLGMLAEEMWWQETREIDEQTFTTLAELACDTFQLAGDVAGRFLSKIPSYALISRLEGPVRIAFRHEFYFAFFLATRVASYIRSREDLTSFLTRSTLTTVIGEEIAQTLAGSSLTTNGEVFSSAQINVKGPSIPEVARSNLGVLYWALSSVFGVKLKGATFENASFNGLNFDRTSLVDVRLSTCWFNKCSFIAANWRSVSCNECTFAGSVVSEQTKLGLVGIRLRGEVLGITFQLPNGELREFYALAEVGAILEKLGVKFQEKIPKEQKLSTKAERIVGDLQRFLRIPERTLYFSEEDYRNRGLTFEGNLKDVVELLKKHGLLAEVTIHRRGLRKMYRLTESPEVIRQGQAVSGSTSRVQSFWKDLLAA